MRNSSSNGHIVRDWFRDPRYIIIKYRTLHNKEPWKYVEIEKDCSTIKASIECYLDDRCKEWQHSERFRGFEWVRVRKAPKEFLDREIVKTKSEMEELSKKLKRLETQKKFAKK